MREYGISLTRILTCFIQCKQLIGLNIVPNFTPTKKIHHNSFMAEAETETVNR